MRDVSFNRSCNYNTTERYKMLLINYFMNYFVFCTDGYNDHFWNEEALSTSTNTA